MPPPPRALIARVTADAAAPAYDGTRQLRASIGTASTVDLEEDVRRVEEDRTPPASVRTQALPARAPSPTSLMTRSGQALLCAASIKRTTVERGTTFAAALYAPCLTATFARVSCLVSCHPPRARPHRASCGGDGSAQNLGLQPRLPASGRSSRRGCRTGHRLLPSSAGTLGRSQHPEPSC